MKFPELKYITLNSVTTSSLSYEVLNRLFYTTNEIQTTVKNESRMGLEPMTFVLRERRSNRLSQIYIYLFIIDISQSDTTISSTLK